MDVVQNDAVDHAKARADLEQAQAQHLANILKRATDVRMAMLDAEYSRGEVSTVAYYQRRQKLVEDGLNGEIAALQKAVTAYEQLAEAQTGSDRDKTLKKAEEAQDKLEAKQAELRKAQIDGAEQERQARKQVTDALLQYEAEYRAAKGETAATTLQQIEQEFQARRKMMQAEGQDTSHLDELERIQKAKAMAAQVEEQINQIYDRIATDERVILDQVARGQITRLEGEKQINALHAQNADAIQVLIDKYKEYADASGDPRLVENARRQGVALDELKTKANELAQDLRNGLTNSFEQLFTDMMTGTKSAGEAFKDFGRSIIAMIAQMIAKMIAMYIVGKLLGWFMGGISGGGGGSDSGLSDAFSGGADVGYAAAGDQLSPGQATIIGEDGPELLIPRATSTVLSNRELNKLNGGGGNVFQFNVDARGADAGVEARVYRAMRFTKDQAVREAVATVEDRQRRR
jgi:lambda family phage tail tape measure protein